MTDEPPSAAPAAIRRGPLAWFARNSVAANVLMILLLVGGAIQSCQIKKEVFPEFDMDFVIVNVPYPGASPEEVEQGVTLALEEAVRGVNGVKRVTSTSMEGFSILTIELLLGADADQALADVKSAVDRVTSLPETIERPVIFRAQNRFQVISTVLYGDVPEDALRRYADEIREELLQQPGITTVELDGVRPLEISIEVSQEELRRYGMTLEQIASLLRASSIELPAGAVKTPAGEVLMRTSSRKTTGRAYEDVPVLARADGATVRLGEIARVIDGYAEVDVGASFDGKPAVLINVFRVGNQTPNEIATIVKEYIADKAPTLPPGLQFGTWFDASEIYQQRVDLLMRNAMIGLVLVLLILGLFLEVKLAFWVTLGIPISFLGAMVFLPQVELFSINMISLFAFILVLGMVVDDAIVVGEVIYAKRQAGASLMEAAVAGVREVAIPVTFAITTTIVFYLPLLAVPGVSGKFFMQIPVVVIAVLLISLVEALVILPAHLAHSRPSRWGPLAWIRRGQHRFSRGVERFVDAVYVPVLRTALAWRYVTIAACLAALIGTCGLTAGGHLKTTFMPKIESDIIFMRVEMPFGTAIERTREVEATIVAAAKEIIDAHGGDKIKRGLLSLTGKAGLGGGGPGGQRFDSGSHLVEAGVFLVPIDQRSISSNEFARLWREAIADIPGIERTIVNFATGAGAGPPIAVELSHPDPARLEEAATKLAKTIAEFSGTYDVDRGFTAGKPQLDLTLRPEARALGLTELELARQIRAAFYGAEAARFQRGRDEVKVFVRLPRDERGSEWNLEQLIVRTPLGGEMPLGHAAWVERGRRRSSGSTGAARSRSAPTWTRVSATPTRCSGSSRRRRCRR